MVAVGIKEVRHLSGEAAVIVSRGKRRVGYELTMKLVEINGQIIDIVDYDGSPPE